MTKIPPESIPEPIPKLMPESLPINPEIPQTITPNPLEAGVETIPEVETAAVVSEIDSAPTSAPAKTLESLPSPLISLTGAAIAGGFAFGLYNLTQAIATSFATKPLASTNPLALSISAAVRTLVVGASTLATGVFAIAAFSLILLALQVAFQPAKSGSAAK